MYVLLLEPFPQGDLHLILWGGDQVCHHYLMFFINLGILCSSVAVCHILTDEIYSLI